MAPISILSCVPWISLLAPGDPDPRAPDPQPAMEAPADMPDAVAETLNSEPVHRPRTPEPELEFSEAEPEPADDEPPSWFRKFEFRARVMTGWQYDTDRPGQDQPGTFDAANRFFLQQARLGVRAHLHDRVRVGVSLDFSDALELRDLPGLIPLEPIPYLRSAHANVRIHDAFQIRAGRFKRPFSRLELRSTGRLPFRGRGLSNRSIVENLRYGDRAIGVMLWGRAAERRVRWSLAVTDPDQPISGTPAGSGVDVIGRLAYAPVPLLSLGVNGGYKRTKRSSDDSDVDVFSAGGDARLRVKGFYFSTEVIAGQDYTRAGDPIALGVTGYASYDIDLPKKFVLQPVVAAEWMDANLDVRTNEAVRVVGGLNLLWRKRVRLMPQVQIIRAFDDVADGIGNPFESGETYWIMLSVEVDDRMARRGNKNRKKRKNRGRNKQ